jgi:hypothetical protein
MEIVKGLVATKAGDFLEVGKFSDASLQRAIDAVTAALPAGSSGAVIRIGPHENGVNVAAALKGEHWSVEAAWGYRQGGPDDWGAQLVVAW